MLRWPPSKRLKHKLLGRVDHVDDYRHFNFWLLGIIGLYDEGALFLEGLLCGLNAQYYYLNALVLSAWSPVHSRLDKGDRAVRFVDSECSVADNLNCQGRLIADTDTQDRPVGGYSFQLRSWQSYVANLRVERGEFDELRLRPPHQP